MSAASLSVKHQSMPVAVGVMKAMGCQKACKPPEQAALLLPVLESCFFFFLLKVKIVNMTSPLEVSPMPGSIYDVLFFPKILKLQPTFSRKRTEKVAVLETILL